MADRLCESLREKIEEQIERTIHLIRMLPAGAEGEAPVAGGLSVGRLLGHLPECAAGFCAVLFAVHPERLAHFEELRALPRNDDATAVCTTDRMEAFRGPLAEGFSTLRDTDLARRIPTIFVPEGETVLTLLLGNLEHLINHKQQLFLYLKLLGVPARTADLYRIRG